jgi:hypothetical protein
VEYYKKICPEGRKGSKENKESAKARDRALRPSRSSVQINPAPFVGYPTGISFS